MIEKRGERGDCRCKKGALIVFIVDKGMYSIVKQEDFRVDVRKISKIFEDQVSES